MVRRVKITIDTTYDLCVTYDVRPDTYAAGDEPACGGTIWREEHDDANALATEIAMSAARKLTTSWSLVDLERITK